MHSCTIAVTECNSRISHGSITSSCVSDAPYDQPSGSTDECAACAVHLKERSKHTCCWTTSSIDTSPCSSPAAHVQRGHSVEGQLRHVKVAIYVDPLQPTRQLTIHAVAQFNTRDIFFVASETTASLILNRQPNDHAMQIVAVIVYRYIQLEHTDCARFASKPSTLHQAV